MDLRQTLAQASGRSPLHVINHMSLDLSYTSYYNFLSLGMSSLLLLLNSTAIVTSSEQNLWWSLSHLLGAASDSDSFKPDLG